MGLGTEVKGTFFGTDTSEIKRPISEEKKTFLARMLQKSKKTISEETKTLLTRMDTERPEDR